MSPAEGAAPSDLRVEEIRAALRGATIGCEIIALEETTSTNDFLFRLATPQTPEGVVVFAERQIAGRGQHGRSWDSPRSLGLWLSILLRPEITAEEAPRLTAWAAASVAEVIADELSLGATVKPPNDIYVAERKVGGVLLELRARPAAPHLGILGLGLNVNQTPDDFPKELRDRAGSLAMALGRKIDRHPLVVALLRHLDASYGQIRGAHGSSRAG